jgi:hypothetical protein
MGWRDYEVKINSSVICRFRHKREDGLAVCLQKAALAVKAALVLSEPNAPADQTATAGQVRRDVRRRCQNCGNATIPRKRGKGMPTIICGIDPRIGWDGTRKWGDTCDMWVPSNAANEPCSEAE